MKIKSTIAVITLVILNFACTKELDNVATSSDGVKISFDNKGKGEPALVFIHGWGNNKTIWDEQVSHFSEKYKVITVDLPGFGDSGNNRQTWTMASFGEDVAIVINKLNLDQVVLVGFSMGGPVVIETAKRVPNRVAGLVLVDVLLDVEAQYPPEVISFMDSVFMDVVTDPTIDKMKPFFRRNIEVSYERILTMLSGTSKEGWRESFLDYFRWLNEDCIESIQNVQAQIIAINSDQTPTNEEAFMKYVPSFKAKIIADVGHVVFLGRPRRFSPIV